MLELEEASDLPARLTENFASQIACECRSYKSVSAGSASVSALESQTTVLSCWLEPKESTLVNKLPFGSTSGSIDNKGIRRRYSMLALYLS